MIDPSTPLGCARDDGRGVDWYFRHYQPIYATYKGKQYKANVFKSGQITLNGKLYDTPSGAGKAVIDKGAVNGWHFWKYKDKSGELVQIVKLRK